MSYLIELAERIDRTAALPGAFVTETEAYLTVGGLSAQQTIKLCAALSRASLSFELEDATQSQCHLADAADEFGPYRVTAKKPMAAMGSTFIISNAGLTQWLADPSPAHIVKLACLRVPFETFSVRFTHWADDSPFEPSKLSSDPRRVVREYREQSQIVRDLSPWLLRDTEGLDWEEGTFELWADACKDVLFHCLASEVDGAGNLVFRGPPLVRANFRQDNCSSLSHRGFIGLQAAGRWVFENERELETRHGLFAAEMARTTGFGLNAAEVYEQSGAALEGARIAYQLGVSQLSRDSLKALADLRKAVSDETAKLSESTRQLAGAVAGALFAGVGLVGARLAVPITSPYVHWAIVILCGLVVMFVFISMLTGWHYVAIQAQLREEWREKLYRFLTDAEYDSMVVRPVRRAERGFNYAATFSGILALLLLFAVTIVAISSP